MGHKLMLRMLCFLGALEPAATVGLSVLHTWYLQSYRSIVVLPVDSMFVCV